MNDNRKAPEDSRELPEAMKSVPVYDSVELFGSSAEVQIEHAGQLYRLRRTSLGKLILTK